ncbi:MAG: flagellin [Methanomicrobiales archaeon]|nr:flagellin [Methanomicrobiales archaeon]
MKNKRTEDAFTGLEAAIVLIAFVVVAAVFSYVVLGAGFFTTQKSQETVYTAAKQASSNLAQSGPLILETNGAVAKVENITFNMKLAAGGSPVDMTKVTYFLTTSNSSATFVDQTVTAGTNKISRLEVLGDTDNLMDPDEMWQVTVGANTATDKVLIEEGDQFALEIRPDVGAALLLQKYAPAGLLLGNKFYEVY